MVNHQSNPVDDMHKSLPSNPNCDVEYAMPSMVS